MNKELEALKEIKRQVGNIHYFDFTQSTPTMTSIPLINTPFFDIIETALKNYEELTNKPVMFCRSTHGSKQALIDMICKNHKEVKITCLEDEKKLKALEIIKECFDLNGFDELIPNSIWFENEEKQKLLKEMLK